jgi:hypothetical protein
MTDLNINVSPAVPTSTGFAISPKLAEGQAVVAATAQKSNHWDNAMQFAKKYKWPLVAGGVAVVGLGLWMMSDSSPEAQMRQRAKSRFKKDKGYLTMRSQSSTNEHDFVFCNSIGIKWIDSRNQDRKSWVFFRKDGMIEIIPMEAIEAAREGGTKMMIQFPTGDSEEVTFAPSLSDRKRVAKSCEMLLGPSRKKSTVSVFFDGEQPFFMVKSAGEEPYETQQLTYVNAFDTVRHLKLVDPDAVNQWMAERRQAIGSVIEKMTPQDDQQGQQHHPPTQVPPQQQFDQDGMPHWQMPDSMPVEQNEAHPMDIEIDVDPMPQHQ